MARGGYRAPANPAPASGPGRLARRTDGGPGQKIQAPSGMAYGDRQDLVDQERTAAMSQANPIPSMPVPDQGGAQPQPPQPSVPFGAPTTRPDEPVTHGVDIGLGGGSEAMPMPPTAMPQQGTGAIANMFRTLSATSASGDLATLYQAALNRGV